MKGMTRKDKKTQLKKYNQAANVKKFKTRKHPKWLNIKGVKL